MSATLVDPGASDSSADTMKERNRCARIVSNYKYPRSKRTMWIDIDCVLREILKQIESGNEADS